MSFFSELSQSEKSRLRKGYRDWLFRDKHDKVCYLFSCKSHLRLLCISVMDSLKLSFCLYFSALTKKFRDLMIEFQVYFHMPNYIDNNYIPLSIVIVTYEYECLLFQTLRQRIDDEYREVVERRVVTGSIISDCWLSEYIIVFRFTAVMILICAPRVSEFQTVTTVLTHFLFVWFSLCCSYRKQARWRG